MPRPKHTVPRIQINAMVPEDLVARMKLSLYSDVEERVPHGAQSALIVELLRQHFDQLDKSNV